MGGELSDLGKTASSQIYFFHVLVIAILDKASQNGIVPSYTMWQKPIIVMVLCCLIFGALPFIFEKLVKRSSRSL
jgi:hypothetical protein